MDCEEELQQKPLDSLWLALIIEAKQCGITLEQVRKFIEKDSGGVATHQIR
ncbi:anti-repressor SinI family protein [Peribacillus sp. NPDC097295]|uniref:anti-repressor SinI family protein n=1 Tax=Peribacillus sp. NPDC097295 TaxID=3364402 RepID=UPI0037FC634A